MITKYYAKQLRRMIEKGSISLSDNDALLAIELYPEWAIGVSYKMGERFRYKNKLYRVLIDHISQSDWIPNQTFSLYTEIEQSSQGDTPDNPIPYNNNMELYNGKFYSQNNVIYHCFRDTGVPVYNNLSDLVGLYVEIYG